MLFRSPGFLGNAHPSISPYEVYATADRPIVIAVGNDGQFRHLVQVLGIPGLAEDPMFLRNSDRVAHRGQLTQALEQALRLRGADDWQALLTSAGVPCGPINDIAQGFALADRLGLDPIVVVDDPRRPTPVRQVANPVAFSGTPVQYRSAPSFVDEDRDEVLSVIARRARSGGETVR